MTADVARESPLTFSLIGGPLHATGPPTGTRARSEHRSPRARTRRDRVDRIIVLAFLGGVADRLFSLSVIGAHARFLIVIPLFFMCESWVIPRMTDFVRSLADSGTVRPHAVPALNAEVARVNRWKDAWWPEAMCLLGTIALAIAGAKLQSYGESSAYDPTRPRWRPTCISASA